ncbi:MAG: hypothetical protein K8R85_06175 [Bacteroidetes bacterium]|nr:hypothetical protein [Bacteroidota bacterium]
MKNSLLSMIFIVFAFSLNAQSKSFDPRLLSKFTKEELVEMEVKTPIAYAYWNFYVANAYQVMDLPIDKIDTHEIKGIVKIPNMNTINIFDLHYVPLEKDYQYCRIEGSNRLLVIISEEQIKEKFVASTKK